MTTLAGKLALVTGASRGIGAATALALAQRDSSLLLVARNQPALEAVAQQITTQGGTAHIFPLDLADTEAIDRFARVSMAEIGIPDIVINNAGSGKWLFTEETSASDAAEMITLPYLAAFNTTRAFLPAMLNRQSGHFVNVTSAVAYRALPGATAYNAACWAMRGFTEALRTDLAGTAIRVTLLASGTSTTPGFKHYPGVEERMPGIIKLVPLLTPERIATAVVHGIERNRRTIIIPFPLRLMLWINSLFPRLTEELVIRTGWKHT
jgi:short-subunit dehydrogenase